MIEEHEERFIEMLTKTIRTLSLPGAYKPAEVPARQLVETLYATWRGECFGGAVRALCMPLRGAG